MAMWTPWRGCTVENQAMADYRLPIFDSLPICHKDIILQPMLESIDLTGHLEGVELLVVGANPTGRQGRWTTIGCLPSGNSALKKM